ncbi:hypothetical protein CRM22_005983 [Opisthorchis felineus]|uniref:EGF-like domain-containing protein n=1 Tax=Opisthorchis felineus TaxID=147828 RepID=A0A4S2LVS0_OPIFE|nr:hypothetical protein CRM22_005983 [Opisthorchis felineus]
MQRHSGFLLLLFLAVVSVFPQVRGRAVNPWTRERYTHLLHILVRECLPFCANGGKLYLPDRMWKKCRCFCPEGFDGVGCERRAATTESNKRSVGGTKRQELVRLPEIEDGRWIEGEGFTYNMEDER